MKQKIKNNIYSSLTIFDRKNKLYLLTELICVGIFTFLSTNKDYGFFDNIVFLLNQSNLIVIIILSITYFSHQIVNRLKTKIEFIVRFKNKDDYNKYIIENVIILTIFIYLLNIVMMLIVSIGTHLFLLNNSEYYYYNISCATYSWWQTIRNGIFVCYLSYVFTYISNISKNEYFKYCFLIITIILLLIPINIYVESEFLQTFLFSTYLKCVDFVSLIREILYCTSTTIIKGFAITELYNLLKKIDTRYYKVRIIKLYNMIKKILFPLVIYIVINGINISLQLVAKIDINLINFLPMVGFKNLDFIPFATKSLSLLSYVLIIVKNVSLDIDKNSCFIFIRVSKKKWLIKKIYNLLTIALIIRLPFYILSANLDTIVVDYLMYVIIFTITMIYLLIKDNYTFLLLIINIVLFLCLDINLRLIFFIAIVFIVLSVPTVLFYKKSKFK